MTLIVFVIVSSIFVVFPRHLSAQGRSLTYLTPTSAPFCQWLKRLDSRQPLKNKSKSLICAYNEQALKVLQKEKTPCTIQKEIKNKV